MKRDGIIHPELAEAMAALGHGDVVCIADAGLPAPPGVRRIDLAFKLGQPRFLDVVAPVVAELVIEEATVAEEVFERSPQVVEGLQQTLGNTALSSVRHEHFKELSRASRVIVRTGEQTPFANILLRSGVPFG